jgi:hypothetical protein
VVLGGGLAGRGSGLPEEPTLGCEPRRGLCSVSLRSRVPQPAGLPVPVGAEKCGVFFLLSSGTGFMAPPTPLGLDPVGQILAGSVAYVALMYGFMYWADRHSKARTPRLMRPVNDRPLMPLSARSY